MVKRFIRPVTRQDLGEGGRVGVLGGVVVESRFLVEEILEVTAMGGGDRHRAIIVV